MSIVEDFHRKHKERLARIEAASVDKRGDSLHGPLQLARIQKAVARYFNIPLLDMLSHRKTGDIVGPRQIAMYLCRKLTPRSFPEIGRAFKGRDHTTVLHAVSKIEELIKSDETMREDVNEITRLLQEETSGVDFSALEVDVQQACKTAWLNARELEGYRRHGGARRFLKAPEMLDEIERARDYLSRVLDDMRGVK